MYVRADTINPEFIPFDNFAHKFVFDKAFYSNVLDEIFPILDSANFFEKTGLKRIWISIGIVEEWKESHEVFQQVNKKRLEHSVTKSFRLSEIPQTEDELLNFLKKLAFDVFVQQFDPRYKLRPSFREMLAPEYPSYIPGNLQNVSDLSVDETEEFEIFLKLSDDELGSEGELSALTLLLDEISEYLEEEELATFVGSESRAGFAMIALKSLEAKKALRAVKKLFGSKFPAGSYARVEGARKQNLSAISAQTLHRQW